jgi:2,3-bisphosphoglycerate-dependent phosphoglycerate mutase
MPAATSDLPSNEWGLTTEGRAAAEALVHALPTGARLVSSEERKAWETLGGPANRVVRDGRFDEVHRPAESWQDDVSELRLRYVAGTRHRGWERHADSAARFESGVADHLKAADGAPVVVATHGMVMTNWLVNREALTQSEAGDFWSALQFPDAFVLGSDGRSVRRYS